MTLKYFNSGTLLLLIFLSTHGLKAQKLPDQLRFNADSTRLIAGGAEASEFYNESRIDSIYLDFYPEDYWQQMIDNYDTENFVLADIRYRGERFDSAAIQFKGQTSFRKPVKNGSEKLSFSVKLDELIDDQDIDGYNNFNFNNAFGDQSFMREVLYGSLSREIGPALQGNFVRIFLNDEDWGLYTNIQQLNGDYIDEWFFDGDGVRWRADKPPSAKKSVDEGIPPGGGAQWGDGTAALNYHGQAVEPYQEYYTLKDSDIENPWQSLVKVCDVLNNTALESVYDSLKNYMDIDATLWFLAREIAFSDDDSYIHKGKMDYYLYLNRETGKMIPMEFDGNSVMGTRNGEWSPFVNEEDENYPLLNILLSVPELRQRYIAHMKTLLEEAMDPEMVIEQIDIYEDLIRLELAGDPKIDFSINQHNYQLKQLKSYFNSRSAYIMSHPDFQHEAPVISEVKQWQDGLENKTPIAREKVTISARASHAAGLSAFRLYYSHGFTGDFTMVEMNDEGMDGDPVAMDGIYSANIPGFGGGNYVRYYLEVAAADSSKTVSYMPGKAEYDVFIYYVTAVESEYARSVVINELMASNKMTMIDEAGETDDWVELFNTSSEDLSLGGFYLSDNSSDLFKWTLPDTIISALDYLVVWTDDDVEQGSMHASFKLSSEGEELILTDMDSAIVDRLVFPALDTDSSYGRWENGFGDFRVMPASFLAENSLIGSEEETAVAQFDELADFDVYPNPASDLLYIRVSEGFEQAKIEIFDISGMRVLSSEFTKQVNVSALDSGLYILRCGRKTRKFVVR